MNHNLFITNATQFALMTPKLISGAIPKDINGNYFRNGPGIFNYGTDVIEHWFLGDGYILKLGFNDGQCTAQGKFVDTMVYKRRFAWKSFYETIMGKLWRKWKEGNQSTNASNTSVLMLKNSPDFLALYQGGYPCVLTKANLATQGFNNFGWITSAFSAHPKVDPQNGDIFNIGISPPHMKIMRSTKDMKRICQNQFKLRQIQSIHDFCLAGDYLVLFQAPLRCDLKKFLWGNNFLFNALTFDSELPTLVHIYRKEDLQYVKTINFEPFFSFHFTNGYSTDKKIVVEYIRYNPESVKNLLKLLSDVPKFSQPDFEENYPGSSFLQELTINLQDFSTKTKCVQINGEFPVCEDQEVGKEWRYTYAVGSEIENLFVLDTIYKYDRLNNKLDKMHIKNEGGLHINEPCLIRTSEKLYILCVVNKQKRSFVHIYEAENLKQVCELELPEFVPPSYHGKWDPAGNDK